MENYVKIDRATEGTFYLDDDGNYHRTDGPAIVWKSGSLEWYINGHRHRLDGPSYIGFDGLLEWYIDGVPLTKEEFEARVGKHRPICTSFTPKYRF